MAKKNTLLGTGADWARQFDEWEKDRTQRVEMSKKMDAEGDMRPLANRIVPKYTNEKFNAKKSTLDGGSTKWRTEAVKELPSKKYGRKYADRLNTLMDEAGVPKSERYQFARWMDAQEHQKLNPDQYPKPVQPKKPPADSGTKKAPAVPEYNKPGTAKSKESTLDKILGGAKKGADEVFRFMNNVNNMATFGLGEALDKKTAENISKRTGDDTLLEVYDKNYSDKDRGTAGKVADFTSKGLGMMATGGGIAKGLQALGLGTKAGAGLGANALRMAGQGSVAGGGDQALRSVVSQTVGKDLERNQNRTWKDEGKDIALGTAFGAVLDPLLTVGPQAIREGARSLRGVADDAVRGNDVVRQLTDMVENSRGGNTNAMDALEALRGARPSQGSVQMNARQPEIPRMDAQTVSEEEMFNLMGRTIDSNLPSENISNLRRALVDIDNEIAKNPLDFSLVNRREEILTEMQLEDLMARSGEQPTTTATPKADTQVVTPVKTKPLTPTQASKKFDMFDQRIDGLDEQAQIDIANIHADYQENLITKELATKRIQRVYKDYLKNNPDELAKLQTPTQVDTPNVEAPQMNRNTVEPTTTQLDASQNVPQNTNLGSNTGGTPLGARAGAVRNPIDTPNVSEEPLPSFMDNSVQTLADERGLVQRVKDTADDVYASAVDELQHVRRAEERALRADTRGVVEYHKPTSLIQRLKGANAFENVKTKDSLSKSLQVVGKGAHSRAAAKTEKVWADFAKRIESDPDVPLQKMLDYAFARHGLNLLDKSDAGFYNQIDDILANNPNLADDELGEMLLDYKHYKLPEGADRASLEKTVQQYGKDPKLVKYYEEFQQLQAKKLDDMYEAGLINKQAYDEMKSNDTYISMARNFHNDTITGVGGGRQARTPIERMKGGSEVRVKNSFQEAIRQSYVTEFNIQKNNALKPIEKYAQIPNSGFRKVAPTEDLRGLNTVEIYNNGQKVMYEVPEPVANYVKNFNINSDADAITGAVQKLAELQRKLTTQYSPAFLMKSALREPVQSIIVSRTNKGWIDGMRNLGLGYVDAFAGPQLEKATASLPKALQFKSYRPTFDDFGGNQFQYMNMADKELKKSVEELMKTGTINGSKNMKAVSWYPKFLNYMGEKVESAPRLGEFRSAKRRGYDDLDAFFEATDLTNFKRSGTLTGKLNKVTPYLNATVQGNERVLRAFKEAPDKMIVRGVTGLSSVATLAYMSRFHDGVSDEQRSELQNLQEYQRNANMFIPNFWDKNSDEIYVIPKPFAVGQMFMNPVERVLDDYYNQLAKDPSAKETAGKIMGDIARSFMPPTGVTLVTPMFENMVNKDTFTGMPIEQNEELPKGEREAYGQSVLTKWVADAINFATFTEEGIVSPADVDNLVKSTIGSEGTRALQATDKLLSDVPPVAGQGGIERILGQFKLDPTTSGRGYQELKKLSEGEDRASIIQGITGDESDTTLRNLNKEQRAEFDGQTNYYNMFKEYADMNTEINAIRNDPKLNGDAKRRRIEYLRKEQDALYSETVDYFNRLNR